MRLRRDLPIARLAAEFVVIVTGVLVALGVDAMVTARSDASRADAYLSQIEIELVDLAEELAVSVAAFGSARAGGARLIEGMSSVPLAPADSLDAWFEGLLQIGPLQPELVTLSTMVASGDLLLIRDQSLRAALTRFASGADRLGSTQDVADQMLFDGFRVISGLADVNVMSPGVFETPEVSDQWDWDDLSKVVAFRSAIYSLANGTRNHEDALVAFSEEILRVQAALEGLGYASP